MSGALLEVSVVVVADGPWEETAACLSALARAVAGISAEVIVVDDGTTDGTAAALAGLDGVMTLRGDLPQGFAAAANAGASVAHAPLLAFLHARAWPHPSWLRPLLEAIGRDPALALIGSRLVDRDGLLEGSGAPAVPAPGLSLDEPCSAAALLVRKAPFLEVGGFGPAGVPRALAVDLARRLGPSGATTVARESSVLHAAPRSRAEPGRPD